MSKIVFFSIYAHGHTNPTIEVVRELVNRGNQVRYYSFEEFREKIEGAGAEFIGCEDYMPPAPKDLDKKVGKDFASLIEMSADMTVSLDEKLCKELTEFKTDCIVADSMCLWGKLIAKKLRIPMICSTTTFAFNKYSAATMKPTLGQVITTIKGMPRINAKVKTLQEKGYEVGNYLELIQNDNDTNTIVYTSKEFQPMSETFSDKYAFVGPSVRVKETVTDEEIDAIPGDKKVIYISLGTVLNKNSGFYKKCIEAFKNTNHTVIMSIGGQTDIKDLGVIPENFIVRNRVEQLHVLERADVFITHCGMNSVNESIYFGVPMVLFPLHSEENAVGLRTAELGAGVLLKKAKPDQIRACAEKVLAEKNYKEKAMAIAETFKAAGGAEKAADYVEKIASRS